MDMDSDYLIVWFAILFSFFSLEEPGSILLLKIIDCDSLLLNPSPIIYMASLLRTTQHLTSRSAITIP